jgi:hypothetical protein
VTLAVSAVSTWDGVRPDLDLAVASVYNRAGVLQHSGSSDNRVKEWD